MRSRQIVLALAIGSLGQSVMAQGMGNGPPPQDVNVLNETLSVIGTVNAIVDQSIEVEGELSVESFAADRFQIAYGEDFFSGQISVTDVFDIPPR